MKKLKLFFVPIVSSTFLFSCVSKPDQPKSYEVKFNGTNCILCDSEDNDITSKKYVEGTKIDFKIKAKEEFKLPKAEQVDLKYTSSEESFDDFIYNAEDGSLSFTIKSDITIAATSNPEIMIYELTFDGTKCKLLDEDEQEITSRKYIEGTNVSLKIKPYFKFEYPISERVKFTVGNIPEDFVYNAEDGSVSFTINEDLKLQAISVKSDDYDYLVSEEEFGKAVSMFNINYLQMNNVNEGKYYEVSPDVFFYKSSSLSDYFDEVITKPINGDSTYVKYYREDEDGDYDYDEAVEEEFLNAKNNIFRVDDDLSASGLTYSNFVFNTTSKFYESSVTAGGDNLKYELKFDKNKLVEYKLTGQKDGETVNYNATYTYNKSSHTVPNSHKIKSIYFNSAILMSDIKYLQIEEVESNDYTSNKIYRTSNLSEKVFERIVEKTEDYSYHQTFIIDSGFSYYWIRERKERGGTLSELALYDGSFYTPSQHGSAQMQNITSYNLTFDSFEFNEETDSYEASGTIPSAGDNTFTLSLTFTFNKLTTYKLHTSLSGGNTQEYNYTYKVYTPKVE